jgi:nucleoside-diphosphate-sugar epimerase
MISSQHGIEVHNMILQHVYGPADGPHKFFPTVLRALTTNQPTLELTEGEQTRDFVYVEDVAEAFMVAALKAPTHSGSYVEYQIGTGLPSTLRTAVEIMHQLTRSSTQLRFGVLPYPPGEIMYSVADLEAVGSLPWVARTTLVDGIKRTVDSMSVTPPEAA